MESPITSPGIGTRSGALPAGQHRNDAGVRQGSRRGSGGCEKLGAGLAKIQTVIARACLSRARPEYFSFLSSVSVPLFFFANYPLPFRLPPRSSRFSFLPSRYATPHLHFPFPLACARFVIPPFSRSTPRRRRTRESSTRRTRIDGEKYSVTI